MRHLALFILACFLVFKTHAQLVPNGNSGSSTTAYTNGAANNPIYIWCGTTLGATNGSLTATPTSGVGPFTFEWFYHDQTTSSWFSFLTTTGATSTVNNLASDGYRVEIRNSSNVVVNCFVAWVWNLNTVVSPTATASGCNANLTSTVNTTGSFTYYNPPPPESIINASTNIQVCFSATHTYVSDLAFYLVGPASCGSPTILLSPNPGAISQNSTCNSGDNVTNLCFSNTSLNNLNVCSPAPSSLSGTYGTYGPSNTPINWSALNGCNAAAGGWRVQIYDCIGSDVGALTNATVTFSNLTSVCGSSTSITYNSGAISSTINDNSCSAASASIFQVPVATNLATPIVLNATTTLLWTSSPATSIAAPTNTNTSASGLPNGTTTFTLTATTSFGGTSCVSSATSSVSVSAPVVNPVANQTHCAGTAAPLTTYSSTPAGATFTWTNSNTAIGLGASGTGNLPSFTATNATASAISSSISVTPTLSGCVGAPLTFTITVNPRPVATTPSNITQCGGTVSPPAFISTPTGATFTWTNSNTTIGLGASGSGNIAPFTGTNATSSAISGTISITPTLNSCVGTPVNFTITINPTPSVNAIANQTHCAGATVPLTNFSSLPAGATFTWTNSNTAIGLGTSGIGNLPLFTATNATASAITSTISVTPTLSGCTGTPLTFSITINPSPIATTPTNINQCVGTVTLPAFISTPSGATFTWTNSNTAIGLGASGSGNIASFSGTNATSSAISGTISITPTLNSCVGSPVNFTITIQPIPTVLAPVNATYCPGQTVPISTFTTTPTGGTTTWTNSNTSIGLGASGSGNIPSFASTNTTSATILGTVNVTPTVSGCVGTPSTFTISVSPTPTVIANPDMTFCNGTSVSATAFASNPPGATFTWANSNTTIGLGANGTGNQPSFIGTNSGTVPISGNVTVTPTLAGCVGSSDIYQITVNPTPVISIPPNITQCAGNVIVTAFSSTPSGASFTWTNSNTSIGLGATGSGNIGNFNGLNSGAIPNAGTIAVTPTLNTCIGSPVNFTITINPTPVITSIADIVDCENMNIPVTNVVVSPNTATISWTNTNTGIGLATSGSGNIPSFLSTNNTLAAISGTVTVSATANGCSATPELFDITINQVPVADPVAAITQCHNTTVNSVNFTSTTPGVTFGWTNSNTSIGLGASGTGALPSFTATNPTTTQTSATITVTPTLGTCVGSPITFSITVNPLPVPTAQNNGPLCPGDALNLTSTGLPGSTYSWTGPNGFVSGIQNPTIASVSTSNGGVYSVTVTAAGCSVTASTSLTVNPNVNPTITQAGPFCKDAAIVLLQASIPGGTWSGNGIVNPVTGQFAPSSASIGNNVITYTVNVACAVAATSTIVINPLPTVQFSAPILSGCQPFTAVFTDNSIPASSTVYWDFGDGSNSTLGGTINHTFTNTGCYNITLTSTSTDGCVASLTLNNYICVNPYADANFTVGNPVHTLIDPEFEMINNSTDASSYSWDFGDGTTSSIVNPTHEYPGLPGTYVIMLAANNASNCPDTAYLTVVVEDQLIFHVPNSFTPDGDEYNNMFEPVFYSGFDPQSYTLLIYDRWGEVLFESHNVEQGWNGAYADGIVKEGTYIWTIQFKDSRSDKKLTYSGNVTLLK